MYSYEERMRAVELYVKLGKRIKATIRQLGYPTKNSLKAWCDEFEKSGDLQKGYARVKPKYSEEQKNVALEHYASLALVGIIGVVGNPEIAVQHGTGIEKVSTEAPRFDEGRIDAERRKLQPQRFRSTFERELRRAVDRRTSKTSQPRDRRHVHDVARALCTDDRQHRPRQRENAEQICRELTLDRLRRHELERAELSVACIIDEHIYTCEAGDRGFDRRRNGTLVGDVESQRGKAIATETAERRLDLLRLARGGNYAIAGLKRRAGYFEPQAAVCAGNKPCLHMTSS